VTDVVVTVPATFWLQWLEEGDCAGDSVTGSIEWGYSGGGFPPPIEPGDRVYVVAHRRLRGYAPLTRLDVTGRRWCLCREAGAVAITIDKEIPGFRGWRKRWWSRDEERPFPAWKTDGVVAKTLDEKWLLRQLLGAGPPVPVGP
jgi:hypothetical protein